jgi:hypothetical protein
MVEPSARLCRAIRPARHPPSKRAELQARRVKEASAELGLALWGFRYPGALEDGLAALRADVAEGRDMQSDDRAA